MTDFATIPRRRDIVIVEGIPNLAKVYAKFFDMAGLRVIATFYGAKEVLDYFSNLRDDPINKKLADNSIVVLSHTMQEEMDGEDVARRLRRINPKLKIILTTMKDPSSLDLSEKLVDGILHKPFSIEDIFKIIASLPSSMDYLQGCRIFNDPMEMDRLFTKLVSDAEEKLCFCGDRFSPSRAIGVPAHLTMYTRARTRGLRVQYLTEISRQNLNDCKRLVNQLGVELRHMDGIQLNFCLADEKHYLETAVVSRNENVMKEFIYSNLETVVDQNQYLFDSLWSRAIPAEQVIESLEIEKIEEPKVTEQIKDQITAIQKVCEVISSARIELSGIGSQDRPEIIMKIPEYARSVSEASRRIKSRYITEITPKNLDYCKELVNNLKIDLRHLKGIKFNLVFSEREFVSDLSPTHIGLPTSSILYSNVSDLLRQQRQLFESIWESAAPSDVRIKEIELGIGGEGVQSLTRA